jgi:hypothetical protein
MVLHDELLYGLTRHNPDKARQIVKEMRWSNDRGLETMANTLEEHLDAIEPTQ